MTERIDFVFPVEPTAVQSARFFRCGGGIRSYQPEKVTNFKRGIRISALNGLPPDFRPFDVPLKLEVDFVFAPLRSMRKRDLAKIAAGEIVWKPSRPDIDNLSKAMFDALNGVLWKDDALIIDYHARKIFGASEMIMLSAFPL